MILYEEYVKPFNGNYQFDISLNTRVETQNGTAQLSHDPMHVLNTDSISHHYHLSFEVE